jgi:hypothetical protein
MDAVRASYTEDAHLTEGQRRQRARRLQRRLSQPFVPPATETRAAHAARILARKPTTLSGTPGSRREARPDASAAASHARARRFPR